jgi:hypothetical protein
LLPISAAKGFTVKASAQLYHVEGPVKDTNNTNEYEFIINPQYGTIEI